MGMQHTACGAVAQDPRWPHGFNLNGNSRTQDGSPHAENVSARQYLPMHVELKDCVHRRSYADRKRVLVRTLYHGECLQHFATAQAHAGSEVRLGLVRQRLPSSTMRCQKHAHVTAACIAGNSSKAASTLIFQTNLPVRSAQGRRGFRMQRSCSPACRPRGRPASGTGPAAPAEAVLRSHCCLQPLYQLTSLAECKLPLRASAGPGPSPVVYMQLNAVDT